MHANNVARAASYRFVVCHLAPYGRLLLQRNSLGPQRDFTRASLGIIIRQAVDIDGEVSTVMRLPVSVGRAVSVSAHSKQRSPTNLPLPTYTRALLYIRTAASSRYLFLGLLSCVPAITVYRYDTIYLLCGTLVFTYCVERLYCRTVYSCCWNDDHQLSKLSL